MNHFMIKICQSWRNIGFCFLALLDYVGKGHEIEIHSSSSVRPAVYHTSVSKLSVPNARISFKFWLLLPLGHGLGCTLKKRQKKIGMFYEYFSFSLIWQPCKLSKRYSYKSQPKVLKFPPIGPHKTIFGIFEILSFRFLEKFVITFDRFLANVIT